VLSDKRNKKPDDRDDDRPNIEEVVTDFDNGIRVRSSFEIEEVEPGVLGISIHGPIFEFLSEFDDDLGPDDDSEDRENQE